MSVVVRMEMPERCKKCKNPICIWINDDGDYYVDTIAAVQDFRKKNDDGFPDFCPILCQLPAGHGRLVDADALAEDLDFDVENYQRALDNLDIVGKERAHIQFDKDCKQSCIWYLSEAPTIVPAEPKEGA